MANKKKFNKEIKIPHLGYRVIVKVDVKEFSGMQESSFMFCENTDKNTATIFLRDKPRHDKFSTVAHEAMHALQFLCRNRNISMERELEHMGYLMQYILNEIYGYEYIV